MLSACAKRNTAHQEDDWLILERTLPVVGNTLDIKIDENYIYVAQDQGGFSLIRRNDYHQTWYTTFKAADGSQTTMGRVKRITAVPERNKILYNEVANTDRITIVDTSNPDTLRYLYEITGGTGGIKDFDSFSLPVPQGIYIMSIAYCSGGSFKYDYYDGNIFNTNQYYVSPPGDASGFALTEEYIFVTSGQRGLFIYDRSDRHLLSELVLPGEAQKIVLLGNTAFIASRQSGMNIVSVANPSAPVLLATYKTSNFATAVDVSGSKAAISAGNSGVYLFDIGNPSSPKLLQRLTSCGYANSAKFMGTKLVVGTRDNGVQIYKVK